MKIAVYAIAKNEEQFVERFLESAKDADYIIIGDTGSTDRTVETLEDIDTKVLVYPIHISPWRFDLARNAVLALIPADAEVCISLDLDEVLTPGWRDIIERQWKPGVTTQLRYQFDWGLGIEFQYEKIHSRRGFRWHHPCHEYPVLDARIDPCWAHTPALLVKHLPDPSKSRGQYMDLLQLSVKEDPHCPRNAFYFARELTFNERWLEAEDALKNYLALPGAVWANERSYAMRLLGQTYRRLGNIKESERWLVSATQEAPDTREPWCDLAQHYYFESRWPESYAAAKRALAITEMAKVYTCDPKVWGWWPHDQLTIAAWRIGLFNESLESAKTALAMEKTNPHLRSNYNMVRKAMLDMGLIKTERKKAATKKPAVKRKLARR